MKSKLKISVLVSLQIILILFSFFTISYLQTSHETLEHSIALSIEIRQLSDSLMFETQKYLGGVPYADPSDMSFHLISYMELLKNGGIWHDDYVDPLDQKFLLLHDNAFEKLTLYVTHLETSLNNEELDMDFDDKHFLLLDNRKFDFNGSMDYLTQVLNEEEQNNSYFLVLLEIGLAIINVGIHIFMILLILEILNKDAQRIIKLEKLATIGTFSSRLAHDLRNPLTVIKGAISLLESTIDTNDKSANKRITMIHSAIERMTHQINDVMDFVRITELQLERHSLLKLLESSVSRINVNDGVEIQMPQNDIMLNCDPIKLDIVFVNLISNAIDAIEKQGTIKIRLIDDESQIKIEVEDSGSPIPLDVMPQIFEPLFTTKDMGTGLGLPSCKNIVEQHGGTILVKNNPTTFTINFPKNILPNA